MSKKSTVKIPFQSVVTGVSTATTYSVSPNSTLSARLAAIADDFDEYRFVKLRYRIHPSYLNATRQNASLAFYPGIVDTPPSTIQTNAESCITALLGLGSTHPSEFVSVPKNVLAGMHTWYKTVPGTPESAEEVQGLLAFTAIGSAEAYMLEFQGICEFKAPINAGSTPQERYAASRVREKKRILKLLAEDQTKTGTGGGATRAP